MYMQSLHAVNSDTDSIVYIDIDSIFLNGLLLL